MHAKMISLLKRNDSFEAHCTVCVPAPAAGRSGDAPRRGGCPGDTRGIACRRPDPGTEKTQDVDSCIRTPEADVLVQ